MKIRKPLYLLPKENPLYVRKRKPIEIVKTYK